MEGSDFTPRRGAVFICGRRRGAAGSRVWVSVQCWDICWRGSRLVPWGLGFISDVDEILHFLRTRRGIPDVHHRP